MWPLPVVNAAAHRPYDELRRSVTCFYRRDIEMPGYLPR